MRFRKVKEENSLLVNLPVSGELNDRLCHFDCGVELVILIKSDCLLSFKTLKAGFRIAFRWSMVLCSVPIGQA